MKLILDHLLEIEKEQPSARKAYAGYLYLQNKTFAKYIDRYHSKLYRNMFAGVAMPKFKSENLSYGMHVSSLERAFNKVAPLIFEDMSPDVTPLVLKPERRLQLLTQVMEGISDIEQKFLLQLIAEKYQYITRKTWETLRIV